VATKPSTEWSPLEIGASDRVFVLTGAGISAESGIATFRDASGLWNQHPVEQVASPAGWEADPALVWRFYSQRRAQATECEPNAAHRALADLQHRVGERLFLCTQNVDDLHERAGSTHVLHMHGQLFQTRCENVYCTTKPREDHAEYLGPLPTCPSCHSPLRPHICWFGEVPFEMRRIAEALETCTVFVTVGSSGAVYPAAGFVAQLRMAREIGHVSRLVYVGPEEPDNADYFDECRLGRAASVLPTLFEVR
jgi:NAD-dependent deacetylase